MSVETLKDRVIFGEKTSMEKISISYSTSYQIKKESVVQISRKSLSKEVPEVYKKVDLADQKRKEIYRKLNEMMGGY